MLSVNLGTNAMVEHNLQMDSEASGDLKPATMGRGQDSKPVVVQQGLPIHHQKTRATWQCNQEVPHPPFPVPSTPQNQPTIETLNRPIGLVNGQLVYETIIVKTTQERWNSIMTSVAAKSLMPLDHFSTRSATIEPTKLKKVPEMPKHQEIKQKTDLQNDAKPELVQKTLIQTDTVEDKRPQVDNEAKGDIKTQFFGDPPATMGREQDSNLLPMQQQQVLPVHHHQTMNIQQYNQVRYVPHQFAVPQPPAAPVHHAPQNQPILKTLNRPTKLVNGKLVYEKVLIKATPKDWKSLVDTVTANPLIPVPTTSATTESTKLKQEPETPEKDQQIKQVIDLQNDAKPELVQKTWIQTDTVEYKKPQVDSEAKGDLKPQFTGDVPATMGREQYSKPVPMQQQQGLPVHHHQTMNTQQWNQAQYVPHQFAVPQPPAAPVPPAPQNQTIFKTLNRPVSLINGKLIYEAVIIKTTPEEWTSLVDSVTANPLTPIPITRTGPMLVSEMVSKPAEPKKKVPKPTEPKEKVHKPAEPKEKVPMPLKNHVKHPVDEASAFSQFREEQWSKVREELHTRNSTTLKAVLQFRWKKLTEVQQAKYYRRAEKVHELLDDLHPDWAPATATIEKQQSPCQKPKKRTARTIDSDFVPMARIKTRPVHLGCKNYI